MRAKYSRIACLIHACVIQLSRRRLATRNVPSSSAAITSSIARPFFPRTAAGSRDERVDPRFQFRQHSSARLTSVYARDWFPRGRTRRRTSGPANLAVPVLRRLHGRCMANTADRRETHQHIRFLAVDAVQKANSGHPGMPLGAAAAAYTLWTRHLNFNPADPHWFDRDRFVLSAGHGSTLLYALLYLSGYDLTLDDLKSFRQLGSQTPGHPECQPYAGCRGHHRAARSGFGERCRPGDRRSAARRGLQSIRRRRSSTTSPTSSPATAT